MLISGTRLGPYEIVGSLGAGGMGEVYRARDTRLDRTVAIKVLPTQLAADPQFRERFDREARAISSLNHPHICALFDVGRDQDLNFLVMEFLDGETLADRLAAGALGVDEALRYAIQIADALDRAHRSGIVHRDLKPANVMLTKSGAGSTSSPQAKLLDFGLAKNAAPVVATSGLSMMPTTPPGVTAQGTILGTFQYMAPEQIEGLEADARTDIFAFGAVLFEMLTGRKAFEGKTRASLLGAILKDDPPPVSTLQPAAPKTLDRIVSTCLAKDPDDRWQSARDVLHELKWVSEAGAAESEGPPKDGHYLRRSSRLAWGIAGVLAVALIAAAFLVVQHLGEAPAAVDALQFTIAAPESAQFGGPAGGGTGGATQIAVSPDGRHVAFVARTQNTYSLWVRSLATLAVRQLPGTEDASFPFWSPDSRFVAFFASSKLKKVQVSGGPPTVLCDATQGRGGTWNSDNTIVFGLLISPLQRISSAGGAPIAATQLDKEYGETSHRWPQFLPDGRHFLFTAVTGASGAAPKPSLIKTGALDSAVTTRLFQSESATAYADGHLLFVRDGSLLAQPFNAAAGELKGDPFPIAEQVSTEGSRYAGFSTSKTGTLVYAHGAANAANRLTWFDRGGRPIGDLGEPATYLNLALSPDDRRVAVTLATGSPPNADVWIIDAARGITSRLTFDPAQEGGPIWSPDGSRVIFQSQRGPEPGLREKVTNGTSDDELVLKSGSLVQLPITNDWSADGRFVAYESPTGGRTGLDLWILPLSGDRKPFPFVQGPGSDQRAAFSPDGRWIAYTSDESSVAQVYVQPFPATGGRFQVSKNGGTQPLWRGDGKELFFLAFDGTMMAAPVNATRQFETGLPLALFQIGASPAGRHQYAVAKDGKRFLVLLPRSSDRNSSPLPLTVVVNWLAAVQK